MIRVMPDSLFQHLQRLGKGLAMEQQATQGQMDLIILWLKFCKLPTHLLSLHSVATLIGQQNIIQPQLS